MSLSFPERSQSLLARVEAIRPAIYAISAVVGLGAEPLKAEEYSVEYAVEAAYSTDDNVTMSTGEPDSIYGMNVSLPVTLAMRSERLEAALTGDFVFSHFDDDAYDSDDQYLEAITSYRFENSDLALAANYDRSSTRSTEFLDTGVVGTEATRVESLRLGLEFDHAFTPLYGLVSGLEYADVTYDADIYQDYSFIAGFLGVTRRQDSRMQLRFQLSGDRYENKTDSAVTADSLGLEAGLDYRIANQLAAQLLVGWAWVGSRYGSGQSGSLEDADENALLLNAGLDYEGERQSLGFTVESGPSSSGAGYLRYLRQFGAKYSYHLSKSSSLSLGATLGRSEPVDSHIEGDREYARISLGLEHTLTSAWRIAATYTYSLQEQSDGRDEASVTDEGYLVGRAYSNAVVLGVTYTSRKATLSR
ncbi:hypothetical protein [Parahaliea mediterranea]|uniref:Outer membrane beta-barrel protein n=1 Tax=Parahaliea mediterranea TaxID=651086 RepID=A0A939DCW7_9GAMM|nr:hypothetical protein [Parahaliea mediterranea]MBN7795262.1 hypothetical protein [Parahaliea mediterranea]